jgi:hypothetical protein
VFEEEKEEQQILAENMQKAQEAIEVATEAVHTEDVEASAAVARLAALKTAKDMEIKTQSDANARTTEIERFTRNGGCQGTRSCGD